MRAPSPRRNGTAAGLRRLCLETGLTLLPIGLALSMAGLLLWLMGVPNHFTLLTVALLLIVPGLTRLAVARLRQALRHRALRNTPQDGA